MFSEAERARDSLNGRYFGGRLVKGELYDQALFDNSDFSGWCKILSFDIY